MYSCLDDPDPKYVFFITAATSYTCYIAVIAPKISVTVGFTSLNTAHAT